MNLKNKLLVLMVLLSSITTNIVPLTFFDDGSIVHRGRPGEHHEHFWNRNHNNSSDDRNDNDRDSNERKNNSQQRKTTRSRKSMNKSQPRKNSSASLKESKEI